MSCWLKQSTAVDIAFGPFLSSADGNTIQGSLTITQPDIRLKKNGGAWAQKSAAQSLTHEENGWYEVSLSTTDTDTLGILIVAVHESGALPVWREFLVVPANVYDSFFSTDLLQVDATQLLGTAFATPTVAGVIEADMTHLGGVAQSATDLKDFADDGYDPSTNKVQGVVLVDTVTDLADNAINDAAVATDMDSYTAKIWVIKDSTTADRYGVRWYKNGAPITSGIASPVIQVIKASDGTDLVASVALTEIGSTHRFKRDETTNKMTAGQMYFAVVSATIDGSTRTFEQQVGRDT